MSDRWASMGPQLLAIVLTASIVGAAMGTFSGLVPGVHVNAMAMLLVSSYPAVESLVHVDGLPLAMASLVTSAAVVHSFVDFVPSVFIGAPDGASALSVLPGHRLLLQGRGMEAVSRAADGSLVGACAATLLAIPLYLVASSVGTGAVDQVTPYVIVAVLLVTVGSEHGLDRWDASVRVSSCSVTRMGANAPFPNHGAPATVVGESDGTAVSTLSGRYRLDRRVGVGKVLVRGTWSLRRRRWRSIVAAVAMLSLSGAIGWVTLSHPLPQNGLMGEGTPLLPLLTGLFGVPVLLETTKGATATQRGDDAIARSAPSMVGVLPGLLVGWMPGLSSTAGTVVAMTTVGRRYAGRPEDFIAMVSSVGTSATVFSMVALAVMGRGRTGAMVAVGELLPDVTMSLTSEAMVSLLVAVLCASALGHLATMRLGRWAAGSTGRVRADRLARAVLALDVALVLCMNGPMGLVILVPATLVGMLPPSLGIGRVHLIGCLTVPVLSFLLM